MRTEDSIQSDCKSDHWPISPGDSGDTGDNGDNGPGKQDLVWAATFLMVGLVMLRAGVSSVSSVSTLVATAANCSLVSTSPASSSSPVTRGRVFITDLECEIVESQQHTKSISKRQCAYQKLDWEKLNWTSDQNSFNHYILSWNCCHKYKYKSINLVLHKNYNWRNHQFLFFMETMAMFSS